MLKVFATLVCGLVFTLVNCGPVVQRNEADEKQGNDVLGSIIEINEKENLNLFEGDIVLSPEDHVDQRDSGDVDGPLPDSQYKRNVRRSRLRLWKNKVIPYEILIPAGKHKDISSTISEAIAEFHKHTCLKFVPYTNEDNWIKFVYKAGCYSPIGMWPWFSQKGIGQEISLGEGCNSKPKIMHELLHTIGFWHEHSRPDRNQYIEVMWENLKPGFEHNFNKYSHGKLDTLGQMYDYKSLMHYGNKYFSKNGKPTLQAIGSNKGVQLGNTKGFSDTDIFEINALYDCEGSKDGWSKWSSYGPCNQKCEKVRERFCSSNDRNKCPGVDNYGIQKQTLKCPEKECYAPVDGHWGRWSSWSQCSATCGLGVQKRARLCDDPSPANKGKPCPKEKGEEQRNCQLKSCGLDPFDCEFETDMCSTWENGGNAEKYVWSRREGPTPSRKWKSGPSGDVSLNQNGKGYYVYAEASKPAQENDVAKLQSKVFSAAPNGKCVMQFAYSMYGVQMGALNVYIINVKSGEKSKLFSKSGNQGKDWHRAAAAIVSKNDYKISFEATRGNGFKGDIALDDIMFKGDECPVKQDNYKSLGCFKDKGSRPFPKLIANYRGKIDWYDLKTSVIDKCVDKARELGYKYFAIQYYGECWSGPDAVVGVKYNKDGPSTTCWNGVGAAWSFMAYQVIEV